MAIDTAPQGEPQQLGEAIFERGLYSGATSQSWTYKLDGDFLSVFAYYGTPTGSSARRSAILEVHGDEELLWSKGGDQGSVQVFMILSDSTHGPCSSSFCGID